MSTDVHTLLGVITDPLMKLDTLTGYYFCTTNANLITKKYSFTEDIADAENAVSKVTASLNGILKGYFDRVEVSVDSEFDPKKLLTLILRVKVTDKGHHYELSGVPTLNDSRNAIVRMHYEQGGF